MTMMMMTMTAAMTPPTIGPIDELPEATWPALEAVCVVVVTAGEEEVVAPGFVVVGEKEDVEVCVVGFGDVVDGEGVGEGVGLGVGDGPTTNKERKIRAFCRSFWSSWLCKKAAKTMFL